MQYGFLGYVGDMVAGPTLQTAFVVNEEQGYSLFMEMADKMEMVYSVRPLGQQTLHTNKAPVTL